MVVTYTFYTGLLLALSLLVSTEATKFEYVSGEQIKFLYQKEGGIAWSVITVLKPTIYSYQQPKTWRASHTEIRAYANGFSPIAIFLK